MSIRGAISGVIGLAMSGCGISAPEPPVTIALTSEVQLPPSYVFAVDIRGETHALTIGTAARERYEIRRTAPATGELGVAVRLLDSDGTAISGIGFTQRFSEGSNHWVSGWIGTSRPLGHCIGTLHPVPLQPAPAPGGDTLFVMYGSIPQDAVC